MSPKTTKVIYWILLILFAGFMTFSGVVELMQTPEAQEGIKGLGYPVYLNTILGVAKIIGVISILQWKWNTLKEWAYAGFTIDLIGASASIYFVGAPIGMVLMPLIFLIPMFLSYFLGKKVEASKG